MAEESYFVPAEKADLEDLELVIGVFNGGKTRAYPVRFLSRHEVIAVTWCPLCLPPLSTTGKSMAMSYVFGHPDNRVNGKSLVLGIAVGESIKTYSLDVIRELGIVQDKIGDIPQIILYFDHQQTVKAYRRVAERVELVFQDTLEGV